jgi:hypothetical protein
MIPFNDPLFLSTVLAEPCPFRVLTPAFVYTLVYDCYCCLRLPSLTLSPFCQSAVLVLGLLTLWAIAEFMLFAWSGSAHYLWTLLLFAEERFPESALLGFLSSYLLPAFSDW